MRRRTSVGIAVLIGLVSCATAVSAQSASGVEGCVVRGGAADASQPVLMMEFLESLTAGERPTNLIDAILESPGTHLVIQQMNLARRVTPAQYRSMLHSLIDGGDLEVAPADSSSRARRGVEGLRDAFEVLRQATGRVDRLRAGLELARNLDVADYACTKVFDNLPRPVDLEVSISMVMGGRAGAAALDSGNIYADLTVMDRIAARRGLSRLPDREILDFFAHEVHHLAMEQIVDETFAGLDFSEPERYVSRVLSGLVLEGSATYLIDFDGDLESHLADRGFADEFADTESLLSLFENVISGILDEEVSSDAAYDEAAADIIGNRYHAAGALMLAAIDRELGRGAVMEVMSDPRKLFAEFYAAVSRDAGWDSFRPDAALAEHIATMGSEGGGP